MTFNDTTNLNGLIQECETLVFGGNYGAISGNTNLLKTFTRLINNGLDEITVMLLGADGRWQYDDTNYSDYPIATTNLVDSQQDYVLDASHIKITGVEILDSEGNYYPIEPIDEMDIQDRDMATTEFLEEAGMPRYYDIKSNSLFLYPKPSSTDVTTTNGLKVYFQREPSYFIYTDTTKKPGFASIFHDIPALFACAKYAKANSMTEKAREMDAMVARRLEDMQEFFRDRNVDDKLRITPRRKSSR